MVEDYISQTVQDTASGTIMTNRKWHMRNSLV